MDLRARPGWGARLLGAFVLAGVLVACVALGLTGGAPAFTWIALGVVGGAALLATVANFGDSWRADEEGLSYENVLLRRLGFPRSRRASWDAVLRAVELERRTWFVEVEGQGRWVMDSLDEHEALRLVFTERGVPVESRERPRLLRRPLDRP